MEHKSFYVEVLRPEMSELLQKEAGAVGYKWGAQINICDGIKDIGKHKGLSFHDDGAITNNDSPYNSKYPLFTIEQALDYFESLRQPEEIADAMIKQGIFNSQVAEPIRAILDNFYNGILPDQDTNQV